jgi:hypothetical protein
MGIDDAAAATSDDAAKATVAQRKTADTPSESMKEPAMAVATPDARR